MYLIKKSYTLAILIFCSYLVTHGQSSSDLSVSIQAVVDNNQPAINLKWNPVPGATNYFVFRKSVTSISWTSIASYTKDITTHEDKNVVIGTAYEYKVEGRATGYAAFGYVMSGIDYDQTQRSGKAILVVESSIKDSLSSEIERWISDVESEGWNVSVIAYSKNEDVKTVKNGISDIYKNTDIRPVSVMLLGHIPVPYSGSLAPDGHSDHQGAWPTDGYYGEMNNTWTDAQINNASASYERHHNIAGDGKFDQNVFPGDLEIQVGRVDFYDMPSFKESEVTLLRRYLDKDHIFRSGLFQPRKQAVIDDNFGYFSGEAFAASGWRNFSSLVGRDSTYADDYFTRLNTTSYLWSYGCGGGNYTGAGGVGSTQNFVDSSPQGVFTMLFGSYFGDWDSQNNFMRASLASGKTLSCVWAGRPHWHFHHMGLGENIGYSAHKTMNNNTTYFTHYGARFVHMALLGDPTLKQMYKVKDIEDVVLNQVGSHISVSWNTTIPGNQSFIVYRLIKETDRWEKIAMTSATSYIDSCITFSGTVRYRIASVHHITTPTGSYIDAFGKVSSTLIAKEAAKPVADASIVKDVNTITCTNLSMGHTKLQWIFSDGTVSDDSIVTHIFATDGKYTVTLKVENECFSDTKIFDINIKTATIDVTDLISISPNPCEDYINISLPSGISGQVKMFDVNGNEVKELTINPNLPVKMDLHGYPPAVYYIAFIRPSGDILCYRKIVKVL